MLAYVFWHQRRPEVAVDEYESSLRSFLEGLRGEGGVAESFALDRLPFGREQGYEDWYPVDDWAALGRLNDAAVSPPLGASHDPIAALAGAGWGAVYRLIDGEPRPPAGVEWAHKTPGAAPMSVAPPGATGLWQRQMVLGPAPELAFVVDDAAGRRRL
jgi:hypothetical protein